MNATFTVHVNITERNVVLTTDTKEMTGLDTTLLINILKQLEGTRNRIKQQIEKYYTDPEAAQEAEQNGGTVADPADAPEEGGETQEPKE